MTAEQKKELLNWVETIRKYKSGFEFTVHYADATNGQYNALKWILNEAQNQGLIESISIGLSLEDIRGESGRFCCEETFRRR